MPYVDPITVDSPRGKIKNLEVLYDSAPNEGGWSVAQMEWEKKLRLGIRWNGEDEESGKGNPQSRGHATWFILPEELSDKVLDVVKQLERSKQDALLAGYKLMAADKEREEEAMEWSEALIGDNHEAR